MRCPRYQSRSRNRESSESLRAAPRAIRRAESARAFRNTRVHSRRCTATATAAPSRHIACSNAWTIVREKRKSPEQRFRVSSHRELETIRREITMGRRRKYRYQSQPFEIVENYGYVLNFLSVWIWILSVFFMRVNDFFETIACGWEFGFTNLLQHNCWYVEDKHLKIRSEFFSTDEVGDWMGVRVSLSGDLELTDTTVILWTVFI